MPVEVVLISTTELQQVVASQVGNIVANHLIVPIPETGAGLLSVHVIRAEILTGVLAAEEFECSVQRTQRGSLRNVSRPGPLPPVAQETVVDVIGGIGGNVGGERRYIDKCVLRNTGHGSRSAQHVAR